MISVTRTEGGLPVVFLCRCFPFLCQYDRESLRWEGRGLGRDFSSPFFAPKFVREATRKYKAKVKGDTVFSANVSVISESFCLISDCDITSQRLHLLKYFHVLVLKRLFPSSYFCYDCALNAQQLSRTLSPKHLQKYVGRDGECFWNSGFWDI